MKPVGYLLIISFFCLAASFANAQKFKTALELNTYFVSINDTLYRFGKEWGTSLNTAVSNKDFTLMTANRKKLEQFISGKYDELRTMRDVFECAKFRLAMLDFLAFEEKMIKEAFLPFEKLNSSSSQDEIKKTINSLVTLSEQENGHLAKIHTAQSEFATKNGFTLNKNE